jgi:hypothetical protein
LQEYILTRGGLFMEYAKDIIYNLKYDRLVSKNKSRTGKLIKTIKENKLIILSIILLIGLIAFDYVLIKNFIKLLMIL